MRRRPLHEPSVVFVPQHYVLYLVPKRLEAQGVQVVRLIVCRQRHENPWLFALLRGVLAAWSACPAQGGFSWRRGPSVVRVLYSLRMIMALGFLALAWSRVLSSAKSTWIVKLVPVEVLSCIPPLLSPV